MRVLALATGGPSTPGDRAEFVRAVAALVACGLEVRLAATHEGATGLDAADLPAETERALEEMGALGVETEIVDDDGIQGALDWAEAVLHLGANDRPGEPPVLELRAGEGVDARAIRSAGQVLPAAR